jgi:CxxC motif-containing protein
MEKKELTCIGCPMGCALLVELGDDGGIKVTGSSCKIGDNYAIKECTNPTRILTTTLSVTGGAYPRVSVKTERDIPKSKIFSCLEAIKGLTLEAPVHIGDIVYENIENTGVNIVATRNVEKK